MEKLKEEWSNILEEAVMREEIGGASLLFLKEGKEVCWLGAGIIQNQPRGRF